MENELWHKHNFVQMLRRMESGTIALIGQIRLEVVNFLVLMKCLCCLSFPHCIRRTQASRGHFYGKMRAVMRS